MVAVLRSHPGCLASRSHNVIIAFICNSAIVATTGSLLLGGLLG
jgi:hypothetical protein